MKITRQTIREKLLQINRKLDESYKPNDSGFLISFAKLTLLLPVLGIFYLYVFFDAFGITYFDAFNLTDAVAVLYQKLMHVILILLAFSTLLISFAYPALFLKKSNKGGLTILFVLVMLFFAVLSLWVLCNLYKFPIVITIIFLVGGIIGGLFYIFDHRIFGSFILITLVFWYLFFNARNEARYIETAKPKYKIILKEHSASPILLDSDKDQFLIFKTTGYYFIKNTKENLIYRYSIPTSELVVFPPYNTTK